ncbi:MAG: DUF2812 domain-containing protein [Erysipelotrichaceae bacterium]|nr:DUF2812 domain-containing protein [Erysipelotrichaceae bacterium]
MTNKTLYKWFWVWDFEKEERWLNEMAQSGWALCKVGPCTYTFEPCEPGDYFVRLEMHSPDASYTAFLEEIGAEYIGRVFQWTYYRRKAEMGQFDIFSDIDSRIAHLDRIGRALAIIGGANLLIGFVNTFSPAHFGWVNLLCATLLMYGLGRIHGKKEALEKEKAWRE